MTEKEKTAEIAFFSNLVDNDAEAWGYANEIPLFKTALEALTGNVWTPCAEGMPKPEPYNPDHIRDATKKVEHIVDVNKKMEVSADDHK